MRRKKKEVPKVPSDFLRPTAEDLAIAHVEWFLNAISPLLIDHFIHGYKHGQEDVPCNCVPVADVIGFECGTSKGNIDG
jgi:hypothetical protein